MSVTELVQHVEEQADWFRGLGDAYELRDLLTFAVNLWERMSDPEWAE